MFSSKELRAVFCQKIGMMRHLFEENFVVSKSTADKVLCFEIKINQNFFEIEEILLFGVFYSLTILTRDNM